MIGHERPVDEMSDNDAIWISTRLFMRRPWLGDLPEIPALPEGYTLRRYEPGDLEALASLLEGSFEDATWDTDRVRRELIEAPDVRETYVVDHAGVVVATASARVMDLYPGSGYLHYVGADAAHRGKKLGAIVSLRVLLHFRELGLDDAVLETQTYRLPAILSYLRLGFVPDYRYGDPDEQLRWARVLPQLTR